MVVPLKVTRGELADDDALVGRVYQMVNVQRSDVRDVHDTMLLPFRLAVFGAGLLADMQSRARKMVLDYDWQIFLATQHVQDIRDACAVWIGPDLPSGS